ncbi:MAG: SusC/RagA family TonB-linked outer membrane protein [Bacteroidaceae bacterium]|nr:SusC/RagA family TonB-linked outer membrane protein [Bacteroidaceae bacterium]
MTNKNNKVEYLRKIRLSRLVLFVLTFIVASVCRGQEKSSSIIGYVHDKNHVPLCGAYVKVDGTDYVAVTDVEGHYVIRGQWKDGDKLLFSFIGFKDEEVVIGRQHNISVTLKEDPKSLGEIVVKANSNVNAIDLRNKAGQIQSIDMKRVEEKPMIDFALALQGQIPGLVVINSGELGSEPKIRLRGNSSLRSGNATNEPLYVLDGKVISADVFYNLNPQDIKDIKVLKDAAACALYGVKAANGVLEITSQRGYKGRTTVNYSMNMGVTMRGRRGIQMMDSAEKLELERRLQNPSAPGYLYSEDFYRKYYANDPQLEQLITDGEAKLEQLRNTNTDWFNTLLKNNFYQRHNVSIKGGNDNTTYYVSGNYSYQGGRIEGNSKEKMGVRMNLDNRLGKIGYLMFSIDGGYAKTMTPNGTSSDPTALVYQLNPYETTTGELWSYPGQTFDDLMHQYKAESSDKNGGASATLNLTPIAGLDIAAVTGIDFVLNDGHQFTPSTSYSERRSGYPENERGIYSKYKNTTSNLTSNLRLTYNHTFLDKHDLTLGANMDYYYTYTDNQMMKGYGVGTLESPAAINQSFTDGRKPYVSATRERVAQVGYGLVGGYTYANTYDVYGTFKRDGSSVLPSDKRWNDAWAVGIGWTPSNYPFLEGNSVITRLNLKASYGVTANLNGVSVSSTVASFQYSTQSYEDQRPLDFIQLYNKDLVPEQNKNVDFGIGLDLWHKLSVELCWYNRRTEQALLDVPIPTSTGYTSLMRNIGVLRNRGVELSMNLKLIDNLDWRLSIGGNLAYNDNKVLDLYYTDKIYTSEEALVSDYEIGKSYDMLYGPQSLGINPLTGYPVFMTPTGEKQATQSLTKDDVIALGHFTPPYTGSFKLSASYKTFVFDMDFYYVHGGVQRYNYSYVRTKDNANQNAVSGQTEKMWFVSGDEYKTYWTPFYTSAVAEENLALYPNSKTVGKSDYLRLSMISLRYRIPSRWVTEHLPFVSYATIGLQGSNLYTWTGYDESDPESGQLAGTTQPVFTLNLNLTF